MDNLKKAFDDASQDLAVALNYSPDLAKASHDAMHHHAVHAAAAARAGKMDEAGQHRFMHLRHALENARNKGYHGMHDGMRRNMDHYNSEATDEVYSAAGYGSSPVGGVDMQQPKMHPAEKHFRKGGGFVAHPGDKVFKEDYKGHKDGPKTGKK